MIESVMLGSQYLRFFSGEDGQMPRIKRWFPVNHDINHSPTVRMLVAKYGAAGLRIWLEMLSISDRAGPFIDCTSEGAIRRLSSAAETRFKVVSKVVDTLFNVDSIRIHDRINHVTEIVNYADYHRTEERKPCPTDHTDHTDHTKIHKNESYTRPKPLLDLAELPEWLDAETWDAYRKHRAGMPKKNHLTAHAEHLALGQLAKWRRAGHDPNEIVRISVMNGWVGLFEPKRQQAPPQSVQQEGQLSDRTLRILRRGL